MAYRFPRLRYLVVLTAIGCVLLALAWHHVLPGGHRLKDLVLGPGWPDRAARSEREERVRGFAKESPPPGGVVFLGSSTMAFLPARRLFPHVTPVDRGVGGETAQELLARWRVGWPSDPAAVVIYTGAADFHQGLSDHEPLVMTVQSLIQEVRAASEGRPTFSIALLGLLPARGLPPERRQVLEQINARYLAVTEALGPPVTFIPMDRPPLQDPGGGLAIAWSRDAWHLNDAGYDVLGQWLRDALPALGNPSKK